MDIYLDVLILENMVMNYLILIVTARFSKSRTSSLRLFLGALTGAAYVAAMIVAPGMKIFYTVLTKIALSIVIIMVSFSLKKLKDYIKTLAIFYISTFIFAGAALAFIYLNQSGGFIRNGIIYVLWQSKWTVLLLSIIVVGIIIKIFWELIQYKTREKLYIKLKVVFENKIKDLAALVDTGNSLQDPITNTPVIIVEFKAIKDILPVDIQSIFEQSKENDLSCVSGIISNSRWFSRFRLIPFTSLGKDNGMLIGFKPDYVEIDTDNEKKGLKDVIIGIYNRTLSKNEDYTALLSPDLV